MKYNDKLVKRIEAWVSENGLIQDGGAKLKDFCEVFNIDNQTYYNWCKNEDFSHMLARARDKYLEKCEVDAVDSLRALMKGKTTKTVITEYIDDEKHPNAPKAKKMTVKEIQHEPNLNAIQYFLNNKAPNKWASTQNLKAEVKGDGLALIVNDNEEKTGVEKLKKVLGEDGEVFESTEKEEDND